MPMTAIVLAAGEGTRMKSRHPKVAHKLLDRPLNASLSSLSSLDYPGVVFEVRRASLEKEFFLTLAKKQ